MSHFRHRSWRLTSKFHFIEQNESLINQSVKNWFKSMTLITFCFLIPKEHCKKISLNRHFSQKKTRSYTLSAVYQTNGQVSRSVELAGQVKKLLFSFDKIESWKSSQCTISYIAKFWLKSIAFKINENHNRTQITF